MARSDNFAIAYHLYRLKFRNTYYLPGLLIMSLMFIGSIGFKNSDKQPRNSSYRDLYISEIDRIDLTFSSLRLAILNSDLSDAAAVENLKRTIVNSRPLIKSADLWLRYLEPVAYMKLNGALPVEWENEVFEKFEQPYRRSGAGLSLMETYLEEGAQKDSLLRMVDSSLLSCKIFKADSITRFLDKPDHFFFANRLFLLNLASIYTTGFDCPNRELIIPELKQMLNTTKDIYDVFNSSFPDYALSDTYLHSYDDLIRFVQSQPDAADLFDHYDMLKNYVNPLFALNQEMIRRYQVRSSNFNDYALSDEVNSIFDKNLYAGQNIKGIFLPVDDNAQLEEIKKVGKQLFYDPLLSGNNKRSCASCHKSTEYFTDNERPTSLQFDNKGSLPRNTPSLINSIYQHLIMLDGKHYALLNQAKDVVTNANEMGGAESDVVSKVMSCPDYAKAFKKFVRLTPNSPRLKIDHIVSAVILYYSDFSSYYSPFDQSINNRASISADAIKGFNVFMGKAQCGTCHFPPQFNGVKPPYISSEFEVLGVPADSLYGKLSPDSGRALINPARETLNAFRSPTIRNIDHTAPYMHNGVFTTVDQVIAFYDHGGGSGHNLNIPNQTLSGDSLHLTINEKEQLKAFMRSLNEAIIFEEIPNALPASKNKALKNRKVGGEY